MNKRLVTSLKALAALLMLPLSGLAQLPTPTYGWNLGNTMEPPSGAGTWNCPVPNQAMINSVKAAGFNTIRIPCAWGSNADRNSNISPTYMAQIKQIVDWSRAAGLTVVINNHWDNGWFENDAFRRYSSSINAKLQKLWTQVANTFKTYDSGLLFACANEPNCDTQAKTVVLMQYYQNWVNTIRATGGNNATRWLVVQGPNTNIGLTYDWFNAPTDPTPGRMVVEVHYYDPYNYTMMPQDESWGYMAYFWGQPYHTTVPSLLVRNSQWGEETHLATEFQKMQTKFTSKGIPVIVGEFWCTKRDPAVYFDLGTGTEYQRHLASRTFWNKSIVDAAKQYGLKPIFWDNGDVAGGAVFNRATATVADQANVTALTGGAAQPPP
ncbi:MAG TPA: glycoside hydrolase family 5 protein [Lacunisphaera sp.]